MTSLPSRRRAAADKQPLLASLAHVIVRHRRAVIGVWVAPDPVRRLLGAARSRSAGSRASRSPATRPTRRTSGRSRPSAPASRRRSWPSSTASGDITKATGIEKAIAAAAKVNPGSRASLVLLVDRQPRLRLARTGTRRSPRSTRPGRRRFSSSVHIDQVRAQLKAATPPACTANLTGRDPLQRRLLAAASGARACSPRR